MISPKDITSGRVRDILFGARPRQDRIDRLMQMREDARARQRAVTEGGLTPRKRNCATWNLRCRNSGLIPKHITAKAPQRFDNEHHQASKRRLTQVSSRSGAKTLSPPG